MVLIPKPLQSHSAGMRGTLDRPSALDIALLCLGNHCRSANGYGTDDGTTPPGRLLGPAFRDEN